MILELEEQFKLVITSIVFAMMVTNLYTFIDIVFSKVKSLLFIFSVLFLSFSSIVYYVIIYSISHGVLSVYIPISLFIGYYIHMRFYDKYFSCLYNYLFCGLSSIINNIRGRWKKWI